MVWQKETDGKAVDYHYLLNYFIPGHYFQIGVISSYRINSLLSKKVRTVVSMYHKAKNGRERNQLNEKCYTISIAADELVSFEDVEQELKSNREEIEEWRTKAANLEEKKRDPKKEF